jgi:hypothetical protein
MRLCAPQLVECALHLSEAPPVHDVVEVEQDGLVEPGVDLVKLLHEGFPTGIFITVTTEPQVLAQLRVAPVGGEPLGWATPY